MKRYRTQQLPNTFFNNEYIFISHKLSYFLLPVFSKICGIGHSQTFCGISRFSNILIATTLSKQSFVKYGTINGI